VRDLPFAVIDLETTGGCPVAKWDREGRFRPASEITEVGVVRMRGMVLEGTYTSLCGIEGPLPDLIQRLTGITPGLLTDAPPWERVALGLAEEIEGRIWVAHNASFDGAFLEAWLPEGLCKRHQMICTVKLARKLVPEASSRSLGALVELLGLSNRRPHRAMADAEATAELLQHLLERAEAQGWDSARLLKEGGVPWKGAKRRSTVGQPGKPESR
jgi:DNA polymerase III epsilon subunit-like protein